MTPAARDKQFAGLRAWLAFASKAHRPAIQAMIDELLRGWPSDAPVVIEPVTRNPELPVPDDGRAVTSAEVAPAASEIRGTKQEGICGADGSVAANVSEGVTAGETARHCIICGDPIVRRDGEQSRDFSKRETCGTKSCKDTHSVARLRAAQAARGKRPSLRQPALLGAQTMAARSARARQLDAVPTAPETAEHRQQPIRPTWRLEWHPEIVIGPGRPAPLKRYSNGVPCPFQDDLEAIADHGSPGLISRAVIAPIGVSTLGFV